MIYRSPIAKLAARILGTVLVVGLFLTPDLAQAMQQPQSDSPTIQLPMPPPNILLSTQPLPSTSVPVKDVGSQGNLPDAPSAMLAQATSSSDTAPQQSTEQNPPPVQQQPVKPQPEVKIIAPDSAPGTANEPASNPQEQTTPSSSPGAEQAAPAAQSNPSQNTVQPGEATPLGTAAAEKVPSRGGAASKPAGVAIGPAKQKLSRSFLLKLGAIAAGAAALGTVYALSKGTSSTPPGAPR